MNYDTEDINLSQQIRLNLKNQISIKRLKKENRQYE